MLKCFIFLFVVAIVTDVVIVVVVVVVIVDLFACFLFFLFLFFFLFFPFVSFFFFSVLLLGGHSVPFLFVFSILPLILLSFSDLSICVKITLFLCLLFVLVLFVSLLLLLLLFSPDWLSFSLHSATVFETYFRSVAPFSPFRTDVMVDWTLKNQHRPLHSSWVLHTLLRCIRLFSQNMVIRLKRIYFKVLLNFLSPFLCIIWF